LRRGLQHALEALLGQQLFPLHAAQGAIADCQYAQFGIHALPVQLPVFVMKYPECRIARAAGFDLALGLIFKHDVTSFS